MVAMVVIHNLLLYPYLQVVEQVVVAIVRVMVKMVDQAVAVEAKQALTLLEVELLAETTEVLAFLGDKGQAVAVAVQVQ